MHAKEIFFISFKKKEKYRDFWTFARIQRDAVKAGAVNVVGPRVVG